MSPQTRRGRSAPVSHRKSASQAPAGAAKPVASIEDVEGKATVETKPNPIRHGRRGRDLAKVKKSSGFRYLNELFGAYTPLLIGFVILFVGVWLWVSFGPHSPTPQDNWSRIETKWMTPREDARTAVSNSMTDFAAQLKAYKDYRTDTKGWIDDLQAVTSGSGWNDSKKTADENATAATDMNAFITAGNAEITDLDLISAAKDGNGIAQYADQIQADEDTFNSAYGLVRSDIMGSAVFHSTPGPLPVQTPTIPPCESPDPSVSPDPSASPIVCSTPGPSVSPGPSLSSAPSASVAPSS